MLNVKLRFVLSSAGVFSLCLTAPAVFGSQQSEFYHKNTAMSTCLFLFFCIFREFLLFIIFGDHYRHVQLFFSYVFYTSQLLMRQIKQ